MTRKLVERAEFPTSSVEQAQALAELGARNRGSKNKALMQLMCRLTQDPNLNMELRWMAYISALQIAGEPVENWPQIDSLATDPVAVFDLNFLATWS